MGKDGQYASVRGVNFKNELGRWIRMDEDRCFDALYKFFECIVSLPGPQERFLGGGERGQGNSNGAETSDESPVVIDEPQETSH